MTEERFAFNLAPNIHILAGGGKINQVLGFSSLVLELGLGSYEFRILGLVFLDSGVQEVKPQTFKPLASLKCIGTRPRAS